MQKRRNTELNDCIDHHDKQNSQLQRDEYIEAIFKETQFLTGDEIVKIGNEDYDSRVG